MALSKQPGGDDENVKLQGDQILKGTEILEHLSEDDLRAFMEALTDSTYDKPDLPMHEARMKIKNVLSQFPWAQNLAQKLHPWTKKEQVDGALAKFKENIAAGNAFVQMRDGKPIRTLSLEQYRFKMKDGRQPMEIAKVVTMPEFRNQPFSRKLLKIVMEALREKGTNTPVMSISKNPTVQEMLKKRGFEELRLEQVNDRFNRIESLKAQGLSDEKIKRLEELWDQEGYRLYLLDQKDLPKDAQRH